MKTEAGRGTDKAGADWRRPTVRLPLTRPADEGRDHAGGYGSVRALIRGLDLLAAIGRHGANVQTLAGATAMNRTTIYRLLTTLEQAGYLTRSPSDHSLQLTIKTRELSEGYTEALWVTQVAAPVLGDLFRVTRLPGNLATYESGRMLVRESTHRFSSTLTHVSMVGHRIPMMSALGKAYLGFSPPEVVQQVTRVLAASDDPLDAWAHAAGMLARITAEVRAHGCAVSLGEVEKSIVAIAMPVRHADRILACVNVVAAHEAMQAGEMVHRHLPALRNAVRRIEQQLKELAMSV